MWEPVALRLTGRVAVGAGVVTERGAGVAAMFGVDASCGGEVTLFEEVGVTVRAGEVVLITGPSGAGKSTLLRAIEAGVRKRSEVGVMRLEGVLLPADRAVIDCFGGTVEAALAMLARAGLSEASLCLRPPATLSEGQAFRYRLAQFFCSDAEVLVADEFGATLDRVTARVVAHQLGKFIRGSGRAAILATTHEDLAEDLRPALHLWKGFGDQVAEVSFRGEALRDDACADCFREHAFPANCAVKA